MCIGIPMQVLSVQDYTDLCSTANGTEQVDITLVMPVAVGDWLLVHIGVAREWLEPERALQITQALQALQAVQQGLDFDHFFADLIGREPELPAHLRKPSA